MNTLLEFDRPRAESTPELSVSIVVFKPDMAVLANTMASLQRAIDAAKLGSCRIVLIDNTPPGEGGTVDPALEALASRYGATLLAELGNIGFGRGHNRALPLVGRYHLVLNPDVVLDRLSVSRAVTFMTQHPDCGLITPATTWPDGSVQYLCKRKPSVFDLALRGFAPSWLKKVFAARLVRYEMRREIRDLVFWDPPIVSGCFMFFRGALFRQIGGFDERYFLYFEDFDLSLRASSRQRIAYVPAVKIVHLGGHAAKKGLRHTAYFCRSAWTFFSMHGWKLM